MKVWIVPFSGELIDGVSISLIEVSTEVMIPVKGNDSRRWE
jgi:hypothetical protein